MANADEFRALCFDAAAAQDAATKAYAHARALLRAGGPVVIIAQPAAHPVEILQRRFLHGPVLGQIAAQVQVPQPGGGVSRYTIDIWKEHFRKRLLGENGYRYEMMRIPRWDPALAALVMPRRRTPHPVRISTEDLGRREYARFIDAVIDHAAAELGVVFHFTREEQEDRQRMQAPRRRAPAEETKE